jgi:hydroxypyruvate reductase
MMEIARKAGPRDLLIAVISGGASALTPAPSSMTLAEKQELTKTLLACGATIHEINTVRKHLSAFKGGQLAALAYPATTIALILSDVIGDDLDVIGSGPTVPDRSTMADARAVLEKYGITQTTPFHETPKPGDAAFAKVQNIVVGSNAQAIDAAYAQARALGYKTMVLSTRIEGETREVAQVHAAVAKEILASGRPLKRPACVLSGGETTVTLRGDGKGGRNQEFVLAAAMALEGAADVTVLSAGTDGTDGPTDAAGAMADGSTVGKARALGLEAGEFLARNDSYRYFEGIEGLIKTGPTGTNVMDVRVMLVG